MNDVFSQMLASHRMPATIDMNQVKADVLPFVHNPQELTIWSNDYFIELAKRIRWE